ncbi:uncharacterized protein DFL_006136 [Arthrobotrys flagrans]|uniref:Uncharacterized protein n=1 Tax=Arthrobotrys flagrans TaxID=97331 RepID=A0A436ZZI7_ARTFL|nr:hypothetical protein DFL_006136 [Arthrobotrys flagrans]
MGKSFLAETWNSTALENVLSREFIGVNPSYVPDPELKALEERAMEAMEHVYDLHEVAERRDAVTKNSEVAVRAIKARFLTPDADNDSNSEAEPESDSLGSGSGLDQDVTEESASDSETGSGQEDPSDDDIDSEADYTEEEWTPELTAIPEPRSALRRAVKFADQVPKTSITKSPPTSKQMKPPSQNENPKLDRNKEKKETRKAERKKIKQAENDFLDFLDRMVRELDNLKVLGQSSTDLFLRQHYAKNGTEASGDKLQQVRLTSRFQESVERMITELFRIGLPHVGSQISTADAEVIAKCALIVGLRQGIEISPHEFKEAIDSITYAIAKNFTRGEESLPVGSGLRAVPATKTVTDTKLKPNPGKPGPIETKKGYFGWAARFFQPSGKNPDLQAETGGRHPFVDPEIKLVLQDVNDEAQEAYENNERYIWGCEYLEADLKDITIETLPSNGKQKPGHKGPEDATYYRSFTSRLFASINTWVKRYIIPARKTTSIKINSPSALPAIKQTLRKFDYFEESDFITPEGEKSMKKRNEKRRMKRQMFFQYLFYQVLYENIWSKWLYGLSEHAEARVLKLAGLDETQKNTKQGHFARGRWFTDNVRRKPTNMTEIVLDHQAHIATTLRQLFVPLLNSNSAGTSPAKRRMSTSAEKELLMIISDAQALQLMFQSEFTVHKIVFDWPGTRFDKRWMVNGANAADVERSGRKPVPGKENGLVRGDTVDFVFQPGLFIGEATEIYEHIVVAV